MLPSATALAAWKASWFSSPSTKVSKVRRESSAVIFSTRGLGLRFAGSALSCAGDAAVGVAEAVRMRSSSAGVMVVAGAAGALAEEAAFSRLSSTDRFMGWKAARPRASVMVPEFLSTLRLTKAPPAAMTRVSSVRSMAAQLLSMARVAGARPSSSSMLTTSSQSIWASDSWLLISSILAF